MRFWEVCGAGLRRTGSCRKLQAEGQSQEEGTCCCWAGRAWAGGSCPATQHVTSSLQLSLAAVSSVTSGSQFPLSSFKALEGCVHSPPARRSGRKGAERLGREDHLTLRGRGRQEQSSGLAEGWTGAVGSVKGGTHGDGSEEKDAGAGSPCIHSDESVPATSWASLGQGQKRLWSLSDGVQNLKGGRD